ncbi:MAG: acylneuraminate cytidylyltransferase family protein [Candidatus Omnitrophota bacterium]
MEEITWILANGKSTKKSLISYSQLNRRQVAMYRKKTLLALIPARKGSKRVTGKNTRDLGGRPLIAYTIEAARKSEYIDRIIVSTDSDEVVSIAKKYNIEVPFKRPAKFATDISPSSEFIIHALNWLNNKENKQYDFFCLLQPTSPFRDHAYLDKAIKKFVNFKKALSLISIGRINKNPCLTKTIQASGFLKEFIADSSQQDLSKLFIVNGAIYIMRCSDFLKYRTFYTPKTTYYLMGRIPSLDIDDELDFKFAEFIVNKKSPDLQKTLK